jgi:hypothetical protein
VHPFVYRKGRGPPRRPALDCFAVPGTGGRAATTHHAFHADLADRDAFLPDTLLGLFTLKLTYPTQVSLLRGIKESRTMGGESRFFDERGSESPPSSPSANRQRTAARMRVETVRMHRALAQAPPARLTPRRTDHVY